MTGTVSHLLIGMVVFIVSHVATSSLPVRTLIIQKIGKQKFKGLYSLITIAEMSSVITAYNNAPTEIYWKSHTAFQHLTLSLMLITTISIIASLTPINSDERTDGPQGI